MLKYALRKLVMAVFLVLAVVTLIFVLLELAPGSAIDSFITPDTSPELRDMLMAKWHLDQPIYVRYGYMVRNVLSLDFGVSMAHNKPVIDLVIEYVPNTLILSLTTLVVIYPVGIVMGTVQGVRQGHIEDTAISIVSLFFYSMPSFWLAMMLQLIFAFHLDLFPLDGMADTMAFTYPEWTWQNPIAWQRTTDLLWHLMLPGVAMGLAHAAATARYMRSSLLEVVRQDYIRTARAKGLPERTVVLKHAMRNALLPIVTLIGLSLPFLFSGSVLVEYIFSWPGMGRFIVESIFAQDTPAIIACFFIISILVVIGNLTADLLYAAVDPRIQYD